MSILTPTKLPEKKQRKKRESNYVCQYCETAFVMESAFLDHVCTQMQRSYKMKTTEGMAAWLTYAAWIKAQGRKVPPQAGFLTSKFYQSFIKFAEFARSVKNIDVERYVRDMVKLNIPPVIWTNTAIYDEWVRTSTKETSPIKLVQSSTLFILSYCDDNKIDVSDLFTIVNSPELSQWVRAGNVSPWLLFGSPKFREWLSKLDEEDRKNVMRVMDPTEWLPKLKANPNTLAKIKQIVTEVGL